MYAVVNAKQFKEAIKQINALGGYAVQVKKDGEVLHLSSYQMPNNCYNGKGEPQYYPCGDLLLVDVMFKLEMPLQNGDFEFVTTIEDLKAGASCASGNSLNIEFEDDKAWCDGKYKQSLSIVDRVSSSFNFKNVPCNDLVVFEVPAASLQFARHFTMDDDLAKCGFNNICIEEGGVVATDGHALGVKKWKMGNNRELGYQVPVPNGVADAILASKSDTVKITAQIKQLEVLNLLNHEKELVKRVVGTYISSGDYSFLVKVENEFRFPDFKKVLPQRVDNHFLINADNWCKTIASAIKGYNYPLVKISEEGDYFVFNIHENRQRKGKHLDDRQAKLPKVTKLEYQWIPFQVDAKLLCKELKAHDSSTAVLSIHDCMIIMESWAGKSVLMFTE